MLDSWGPWLKVHNSQACIHPNIPLAMQHQHHNVPLSHQQQLDTQPTFIDPGSTVDLHLSQQWSIVTTPTQLALVNLFDTVSLSCWVHMSVLLLWLNKTEYMPLQVANLWQKTAMSLFSCFYKKTYVHAQWFVNDASLYTESYRFLDTTTKQSNIIQCRIMSENPVQTERSKHIDYLLESFFLSNVPLATW